MEKHILVTYASKAGSTAEVAARIGEILARRGCTVDVMPVSKVTGLEAYSAVVVGSAIRIGKLLPEAMTFIEKNQTVLQQKPFSVFLVCMTMNQEDEASRQTVSAYLDPVRLLVKPACEGLFAGVIDPGRVGLLDRMAIKMIKAPIGDFRKWDRITAWAESLPVVV